MSYESSQVWEEVVKTALEADLDRTIPKREAKTPQEIALRDRQRYQLSRKIYLVPALPWKEGKNA